VSWSISRPDPEWVRTPKDVSRLLERFEATDMAAIDTETTGLDIANDEIMFWSLSFGQDRWFLERRFLWDFEKVWADKKRTWIGTNTKYDAHMMANAGCDLAGDLIDTLVQDRLLNPDYDHGLKEVYEREFNERMMTFAETFYPIGPSGKPYKPKGKSLEEIMWAAWDNDPERVVNYASLDAWASYRVYKQLNKHLSGLTTWRGETLSDVYYDFELPFTKVLYKMERRGIHVDGSYLESLRPKIDAERQDALKRLAKAAGQIINPGSPKQLAKLFFEDLKLKVTKKTPAGAPSTDESVLTAFAEKGIEEARLVLRVRKLDKIEGTYINGMLKRLDRNSRIHGTFKQHVADTARLSSADPNLQNIPRSSGDEFKIRGAFTAKKGCVYIAADYDQIELYLAAHFSGDVNMINAILEGKDLHCSNASLIWEEPYEDMVTAKKISSSDPNYTKRHELLQSYRQYVKIIGFGLLYGKGPNRLAEELNFVTKIAGENPKWGEKRVNHAAKLMAMATTDKFFAAIPSVKAWIEQTHKNAADTKYVETLSGRRRWLTQIMDWDEREAHQREAEEYALLNHRDPNLAMCWCSDCKESRAGERRSVNTIIQGSAADVIQAAMITNDSDPRLSEVEMVLQVHDENGFECPTKIVDSILPILKYNFEHPGFFDDLSVPLRCDPGVGPNWMEAK